VLDRLAAETEEKRFEVLKGFLLEDKGAVSYEAASTQLGMSVAAVTSATEGEGGMPGGMLTLSADPTKKNTGIVWSTAPISGNANKDVVEGIVRAYDAATLDTNQTSDKTARLKLLWDSTRIASNRFAFSKFCTPFVADGKLFVTTYGSWPDTHGNHGRIDVYSLK